MSARASLAALLCALAVPSLSAAQTPEVTLPPGWTICKSNPKPSPGRPVPHPAVEVSVTCAAAPAYTAPPQPELKPLEEKDDKLAPPKDKGKDGAPDGGKGEGGSADSKPTTPSAVITGYVLAVGMICVFVALLLIVVAVRATREPDGRFAFRRDWGGFGGGGGEGWHLSTPLVLFGGALILLSLSGFLGIQLIRPETPQTQSTGDSKVHPTPAAHLKK
jgi:hypothetical protein